MLSSLLQRLPLAAVYGDPDIDVTGIAQDSREVVEGGMFVAISGFGVDGHDYIDAALQAGARTLVGSRARPMHLPDAVTWVRVEDTRVALAEFSRCFFGDPSEQLPVLAVTGTNGKTSTVWLLDHILRTVGGRPGVFGTVHARIGDRVRPTIYTTPPAHILQSALAEMRGQACTHALIEASSHGLELGRTLGTRIRIAGFTNLSRDHMDFHETMEAYEASKWRLFDQMSEQACFWIDDPVGRRFAERYERPALTVGTAVTADLRVSAIASTLDGSTATLHTPEGETTLRIPLPGSHNVANALVALGMARLDGVPLDAALSALAVAPPIPGRLERIPGPRKVLVDYAHTPDALEKVLRTLRGFAPRRLVCVFGAGGDRDPGKRPQMGAMVSRLADVALVTSDNPRTEDPEMIVREIVAGIPTDGSAEVLVEVDRRLAIHQAIAMAHEEDIVLVAGKGHETYQVIGTSRTDFDDRLVAAEAMGSIRQGVGV